MTAALLSHLALWLATATLPAQTTTTQRPAPKRPAVSRPAAKRPAAPPTRSARAKTAAPRTPRPSPPLASAPTAAAPASAPIDPAFVALDRALPAAGGRIAAHQLLAAGDSSFVHLALRFGDPIALSGRTAEVAVLRHVLATRLGRGSEGAAQMLGPGDPWQLGTDTPGALAIDVATQTALLTVTVRAVIEQVRVPLGDAEVTDAIDQLFRRLLDRRRDATAAMFAEAARMAQPYPADHPRHVPESRSLPNWYARVRTAEVRQLHEQLRRAELRAAVVSGRDAAQAQREVTRATADWTSVTATRIPEMFSPPQGERRTVVLDEAGWTGIALVQSVPIRLDDPDWLPLRLAAWMLGGSPTARRFAPSSPGVLGGGAAFDAAMADRAGVFVLWGAASPAAARPVEQQWRALLGAALRDGFTDAEVAAAATEWLAARAASRESPRAVARQLVARLDAGQTFAGWDAVIEARARTLTGRAVSDAVRRQLDPDRFAVVEAGLPAAMP
ncbi:MAG: hypothetical protein SFW08_14225 [Gemmatimonadaceae bacterium]|nr:hypothetical protein [Gemmatimonadaceae bacterium]